MLWDRWCFIITFFTNCNGHKIFHFLFSKRISFKWFRNTDIFGPFCHFKGSKPLLTPSQSVHYFRGINYNELFNWPNSKHTTTKSKGKFEIVPSLTRLSSVHCKYTFQNLTDIFSNILLVKILGTITCLNMAWNKLLLLITLTKWEYFHFIKHLDFLHQHFSFSYLITYILGIFADFV